MINLTWNNSFEKALKKYINKHPGKEITIKKKLQLFCKEPFSQELKNHKLSGKLKDLRAIV
jgi:mRNA-degrading endonuclease YafQ of YafQ-DinJ toxin-antitoxin module